MPLNAGMSGRCPHCQVAVRFEEVHIKTGHTNLGQMGSITLHSPGNLFLELVTSACPNCRQPIVAALKSGSPTSYPTTIDQLLWPYSAQRPVPPEVEGQDPGLAADFREAVGVFDRSKKASAALSRRCLQTILVTKGGATSKDLAAQIEEVLPKLPPELGENVDAIRQVGNFAAHPMKSKASGEIAQVEEGEAEWLLEVLEELFDHYYVGPARAAERREALNKKLEGLGKPALKKPGPER